MVVLALIIAAMFGFTLSTMNHTLNRIEQKLDELKNGGNRSK